MRAATVTVVDRAGVPQHPVRPQKPRSALAGLVAGLFAGLLLVLARHFLANALREPEEIERYLHLDLLAAVPRYTEETFSLAKEAYQNLRTALIFARRDESGQVVLVTGTAPQEGKTTTILNLALALAGAGEKTVVVDCDLRRPNMHQLLELSREPGFTDAFTRRQPVEALVRPTTTPNLFALTAGPLPPNPPALLAQKTLTRLFETLREHYDWILVDSPPVASVTDALLLARHSDHTVLVVRQGSEGWPSVPGLGAGKPEQKGVDKRHIKRAVAALKKVTPHLLGAVFNVVDVQARGYGYYGYGYYSQREGDDVPAKQEKRPEAPVKA